MGIIEKGIVEKHGKYYIISRVPKHKLQVLGRRVLESDSVEGELLVLSPKPKTLDPRLSSGT